MIPTVFPWKHRHGRVRKSSYDPVVIASEVSLARNIRGLPFPGNASLEQKDAVLKLVRDALGAEWKEIRMEDMGELDRVLLEEAKLIPHGFAANPQRRSLFFTKDGTTLLVNGNDHLLLRVFAPGLTANRLYEKANAADDALSEKLALAFHPRFGFMTEDPSDTGTGLHASVLMHLPGIVLTNGQATMLEALKQMNLGMKGFFGANDKFPGNLFTLTNTSTLGEMETGIAARVSVCAAKITTEEMTARDDLKRQTPLRLMDFCERSKAVLSCARLISANETMNALSGFRLASECGLLNDKMPFDWDDMLLQILPGQISALCGNDRGPEQRAAKRAELLRTKMSGSKGNAPE